MIVSYAIQDVKNVIVRQMCVQNAETFIKILKINANVLTDFLLQELAASPVIDFVLLVIMQTVALRVPLI